MIFLIQSLLSLLLWKPAKEEEEEKYDGVKSTKKEHKPLSKDEIYRLRKKHVAESCILFYDPKPLQIVRARAQYMYDEQDNEYLDCINNVCHVGHCHPDVVKAGQDQMAVLNTNSRYLSELNASYAKRLTDLFPEELDTVYFMNSGSEATDFAMTLCEVYTGHRDFICVDSGYHGHVQSATSISDYKFNHPKGIGKPSNVHKMDLPDTYQGQYRGSDAGPLYAAQAEVLVKGIQDKANGVKSGVAGFIAESMLSCGGQIILPEGYLKTCYQTVRAAGGLCIADEVQVGFGRCGEGMWSFAMQGVVPDIVTIGKPMGNGHPMSAVVTKRAIADRYYQRRPEYFNTYGGNPVSCAIGLAVLDVIEQEGLIEHAKTTGDYFLSKVQELYKKHTCIGNVRGKGLFLGIEFVKDRDSQAPDEATAVSMKKAMYKHMIIVSTEGKYNNIMKVKPPMTFDKANVDRFCEVLDREISDRYLANGY